MSFTVEKIEKQVECPEHGLVGAVFVRHKKADGFATTMEVCSRCLVDGMMVLEPPIHGLSDETLAVMKKALSTGYTPSLDGKVIDIDASHLADKMKLIPDAAIEKLKKLAEAWVFADRDETRIRAAIDVFEAIDRPDVATAMRLAWVVEKERLDSDDS